MTELIPHWIGIDHAYHKGQRAPIGNNNDHNNKKGEQSGCDPN